MEIIFLDNGAKIEITDPVSGDEKGLAFVKKETWLDTYPNEEYDISKEDILAKNFDSEPKLKEWREVIANNGKGDVRICAAKDSGRVIGFCFGTKKEEFNEITALYVLFQYQGRGIGTALARAVLGWLGKDKRIALNLVVYNKKAGSFYEKLGFARSDKPFFFKELPNNKKLPVVEMELNF
jgi:GNAT superfamily N-acetyltransferase